MKSFAFAAFMLASVQACDLSCDECDSWLDQWDFDGYKDCLVDTCHCEEEPAFALTEFSKRTLGAVKQSLQDSWSYYCTYWDYYGGHCDTYGAYNWSTGEQCSSWDIYGDHCDEYYTASSWSTWCAYYDNYWNCT